MLCEGPHGGATVPQSHVGMLAEDPTVHRTWDFLLLVGMGWCPSDLRVQALAKGATA